MKKPFILCFVLCVSLLLKSVHAQDLVSSLSGDPESDPAYSLCFDGVNDYVTVAHNSSLNPGAGSSWTIELWAMLENTTTARSIIGKRSISGNFTQVSLFKNGADIFNQVPGKRICFLYYQSAGSARGCYTNNDVVDGNWHHIAVVADQPANTLRIYIDGVLQPTTLAANIGSWPDPSNPDPLFLGYANTGSIVTDGSMREVRIWKSARTQAQINQYLYASIPDPASETTLKAYFPCDEGTGQVVNDNSLFGNTGMMGSTLNIDTNDPSWCTLSVPQEEQRCLDFDGVNDFVQIANHSSLNPTNQITVEAWYKPVAFNGTGSDPIVDKGYISHSPPYYQYQLSVVGSLHPSSPSTFCFSVAVGGNYTRISTTQDFYVTGRWYHLAGVYDGSFLKLYVNGNLESSTPASGTITDYGKPVRIGTFNNYTGYLPGQIDEVRIWNTARTQDEIRHEMHHQLSNPAGLLSLVAYYRFNQTGGLIAGDLSSYGNNGILTNMAPATDWVVSTAPIPYYTVSAGSWETNDNWANGQYAPENAWARTIVNHDLSLNSSKELIELNIGSTGSLDITQSNSLTVSDELVNQSGTDGLILRSGPGGTATIIENDGTEATVERYFTGNTSNWHLVSSPLSNSFSGVFTEMYLQRFSENTGQYYDVVPATYPLTPLTGFGLYSNLANDNTVTYSGNLNSGAQSVPVTISGTFPYGWNLLGNPYASYIDWNAVSIPAGVGSTIYYLDAATGNWLTWNGSTGSGSRFVPTMQGFFVSTSQNTTFTLDNTVRTHTGIIDFYKDSPGNLMVIRASGNGFEDKCYLSFSNQASEGFDLASDAYKIRSDYNDLLPQIFSFNENTRYSIDYRPDSKSVNLGFEAGAPGIFTIDLAEKIDFNQVWLEDQKNGVITEISAIPYVFSYNQGYGLHPFKIHLIEPSSPGDEPAAKAYASGNTIYLSNECGEIIEITLTDVNGKICGKAKVSEHGTVQVFSHLKDGIYIIKLNSISISSSVKVVVKE